MKYLAITLAICVQLLASGCSHSPPRVDCDARLEAINPVTPVAKHKNANETGREP